jgi:hypothetical protein
VQDRVTFIVEMVERWAWFSFSWQSFEFWSWSRERRRFWVATSRSILSTPW